MFLYSWIVEDKMPIDSKFFEDFPLYRKMTCAVPDNYESINKNSYLPPIVLDCEVCKSKQTFQPSQYSLDGETFNIRKKQLPQKLQNMQLEKTAPDSEEYKQLKSLHRISELQPVANYLCAACHSYYVRFMFILLDDGKAIMKTGQFPIKSIDAPDSMKRLLGDHIKIYKKGLINESQGYGIGAFAYYRRIVEDMIGSVLTDIESVIGDDAEKEKYHLALATVKKSQSAATRIEVVKDLVPAALRPDGVNPLNAIYQALSVGLHELSDEDCLEFAAALRESLVYLVEAVTEQRKNAQKYKAAISGVLSKLEKVGKNKQDVK
jgi:hypothetical protein